MGNKSEAVKQPPHELLGTENDNENINQQSCLTKYCCRKKDFHSNFRIFLVEEDTEKHMACTQSEISPTADALFKSTRVYIPGSRAGSLDAEMSMPRSTRLKTDMLGSRAGSLSAEISMQRSTQLQRDMLGSRAGSLSVEMSMQRSTQLQRDMPGSRAGSSSAEMSMQRSTQLQRASIPFTSMEDEKQQSARAEHKRALSTDMCGTCSEEDLYQWQKKGSFSMKQSGPRRYSLEIVAQAAAQQVSSDEKLPEKCQELLDSSRMKGLLTRSWATINAKQPSIIDTCILNSVKVFQTLPYLKKKYTFLEGSQETMALLDKACSLEHIHQTVNTISMSISHLNNEANLTKVLRKMGARHEAYDVNPAAMYLVYMDTIAYALKELAAADLHGCGETLKCWELLCHIIGLHAMEGARRMSYTLPRYSLPGIGMLSITPETVPNEEKEQTHQSIRTASARKLKGTTHPVLNDLPSVHESSSFSSGEATESSPPKGD